VLGVVMGDMAGYSWRYADRDIANTIMAQGVIDV
jgi:hypothetical protein